MLGSYWRHILAAVAGLIALGGIGGVGLYTYDHFYDAAEQQYPKENYQPARDSTKQPALVKKEGRPKPYDPHCQEPQNKDDADLCAQWGAVQAVSETNRLTAIAIQLAYIGFWIAALGGIIGVVGTWFLIKTFRESKRAADAAHDANRPWLQVEVSAHQVLADDEQASIELNVRITNRGNSPAVAVQVGAEIAVQSPKRALRKFDRAAEEVASSLFIYESLFEGPRGDIIFPGETPERKYRPFVLWDDHLDKVENGCVHLSVAVGVSYVFSTGKGRTIRSFDIAIETPGQTSLKIPGTSGFEYHRAILIDSTGNRAT